MTADGLPLWDGVERLVARAPRPADLQAHGLQLFAVRRWRREGRPVPPQLERDERLAAVSAAVAPILLGRIRELVDGPVVLLKGPEVAARYPDVALRPFKDLDLLVEDPPAAQRALVRAGFVEVGNPALYVECHHLRPLHLPGQPLLVEFHALPKLLPWMTVPPPDALFAAAVPSATAVAGVQALPTAEHAVLLAAHGWEHSPLRRALDLVDVLCMAEGLDRAALDALAAQWGMRRVWRATLAAAEAVVLGARVRPWPLRTWGQAVTKAREPVVVEVHLERWLSPFAALPPRRALAAVLAAVADDLRPHRSEGWGQKRVRVTRAVRDAFVRRREHEQHT